MTVIAKWPKVGYANHNNLNVVPSYTQKNKWNLSTLMFEFIFTQSAYNFLNRGSVFAASTKCN